MGKASQPLSAIIGIIERHLDTRNCVNQCNSVSRNDRRMATGKYQAETGRDDLMDILPLAAFLKRNSNP